MNNMTSGLICPHQFYTCCSPTLQLVVFYDVPLSMMVPQQVYLHGQWLVKRHHRCSSTWWARGDPVGVIFFRLFSDFQKCLFTHFFSLWHYCAYTLCLTGPYMVENLFTGVPSVHVHTVVPPFYFVTQPDDTESHMSWWNVPLSASQSLNIFIPYLWRIPLIWIWKNIHSRNGHTAASIVSYSSRV